MLVLELRVLHGLALGLWIEPLDDADVWFLTLGFLQIAAYRLPKVAE